MLSGEGAKKNKPSQDTEYWARVLQQTCPAMLHTGTSSPCLHPGASPVTQNKAHPGKLANLQ
jgi:hypothetical protein